MERCRVCGGCADTDTTRVACYNPFVSLYWLSSGKSVGDCRYIQTRIASTVWKRCACGRSAAAGSRATSARVAHSCLVNWRILPCCRRNCFSIPEEQIKNLQSVLTMAGGKSPAGKILKQHVATQPRWAEVLGKQPALTVRDPAFARSFLCIQEDFHRVLCGRPPADCMPLDHAEYRDLSVAHLHRHQRSTAAARSSVDIREWPCHAAWILGFPTGARPPSIEARLRPHVDNRCTI